MTLEPKSEAKINVGDPLSSLFESSLAWLEHLRKVYEESE